MTTFMGHFPAGTSFRCAEHFRQEILAKKFQKFDYAGEDGANNKLIYDGLSTPPEYNLTSFSGMPIALFCGKEDLLAAPGDYLELKEILT